MKKLKFIVVAILAMLLLAGCAQLFEFNLFKGLDKPRAPTAANYTPDAAGLNQLQVDLSSPAVTDALKADQTAADGLEKWLWDTFLASGVAAGDPTGQQAAILYAELSLSSTEGDTLVNNIVNTAMNGLAPGTTVESMLSAIIPPDVAGNQAAFEAMITGLIDANKAYTLLGNSIKDVNGNGVLDPGDLPPGTNMGDVAQKALISYLVATVANTLWPDPATAGTQIYYLLYDPTNPALKIGNDTIVDPFATSPQALLNIFAATGLPIPA